MLFTLTLFVFSGHVVEMATNCYGTHVVQKALECEEDIKRIIVNELLENDPAFTLTSKHCRYALYESRTEPSNSPSYLAMFGLK